MLKVIRCRDHAELPWPLPLPPVSVFTNEAAAHDAGGSHPGGALYDFWQFLHVTSAIVWVGGAVMTFFLSLRLSAARDNPLAAPASGLIEKTAVPVFIVASLATLVTGLVMAFGWLGFGPLWIKIGLVGIILSLVVGFAYFKPHGEKIEAAIVERGPNDAGVQGMVRQSQMMSAAELVVLALVVWAMVAKPS